jgi:hypothetical protein
MERFLTFDRLIASHRNRLDVTPFPEDKLNMAYQDNKYNQFKLHLDNGDPEMTEKVITEIYNQLQSGTEVYKYAIDRTDILNKIFDLLIYSDDNRIREISSLCFKQYCMLLVSKEILNDFSYIKKIPVALDDEIEAVRENVLLGLIYFAQSRYGTDKLLENNILQRIIKKIVDERSLKVLNLILTLSLEILNSNTAPKIALENKMIQNIKSLLFMDHYRKFEDYSRFQFKVLENVLLNYGSLSLCEEGKQDCINEGSLIKIIINFLNEHNSKEKLGILIATIRFFMSVSILKKGKEEIFEYKGLDYFMVFLIILFIYFRQNFFRRQISKY